MSGQHCTKIVRHDQCVPQAPLDSGRTCDVWQATFEVRCSCGFVQGASCREQAEEIERGHRAKPDVPDISWDTTPLTADTITDQQLSDLFSRHCECRPLELTRTPDDHAAIHDCDTVILHDVQIGLYIIRFDDIGRVQAIRQARERCAQFINEQRKTR